MPLIFGSGIFSVITSIDDVAAMLGSSRAQLTYLLYVRQEASRYRKFNVPKRRGGSREILSPRADLKSVQRRLADYLQDRLSFSVTTHGFVRDRSIVSNAKMHARHRMVFNVDLENFFPSINFGRVRGVFMAPPFEAPPNVATILAQICCHDGILPQGAPTSPVISNMICYRMDRELFTLARSHHCIYTRYADDLTFSRRNGNLPPDVMTEDEDSNPVVGSALKKIIEHNDFKIHPDKVSLYRNTNRQIVVGLTVNKGVNVPRRFIRDIRAIINDWRLRGREFAQAKHHENHYRWPNRLSKIPAIEQIVEGKLNFLGMVKGVRDPVRINLQTQLANVWSGYLRVMEKEIMKLESRDLFISHASEDKAALVRPLVEFLISKGVSVWYDEYEVTIGDDLLAKISDGLGKSRYGLVVLSPNFFNIKKTWTPREVGALFAMEDSDKRSRILPIWHEIDHAGVVRAHPILASKVAWKSSELSPEQLAINLAEFLRHRT